MSTIEVDKIIPQSGTDTQLGESGDTITIPAGATITNNGTASGFDTDTNDKVKVSTNDTTPGFLNGKLVAGTNITLTEGSDGGNETLTVAGAAGTTLSGSTNNTVATVTGANALAGEANLTFDGSNLTVASTSAGSTTNPFFNIDRNSSSPADNDVLGRVNFRGRTDTGANADYAFLTAQALDVSNGGENGSLNIGGLVGAAERSFIKCIPTEVVINEQSEDMDFRVESNANTHALFVQASDGAVHIGTSTNGSAGAGDLVVNGGIFLGGTAAANKLDDYEEGTFTPAFSFASGSIVHSAQNGVYTKVGRMVNFSAYLHTSGLNSPSGNAEITGLPFAVQGEFGGNVGIMYRWATANLVATLTPRVSGSGIQLFIGNSNVEAAHLQGSNFNGGSVKNVLLISGTYPTT